MNAFIALLTALALTAHPGTAVVLSMCAFALFALDWTERHP